MKIIINAEPRSKKNSQEISFNRKTGKRFIRQSDLYLQYEKECGLYLKKYNYNISDPINLKCIFYVKDRRKRDLANYIEAIQDILVKYNVISDDNHFIVVSLDGSRMLIDKERPRVEIEIAKIKEIL